MRAETGKIYSKMQTNKKTIFSIIVCALFILVIVAAVFFKKDIQDVRERWSTIKIDPRSGLASVCDISRPIDTPPNISGVEVGSLTPTSAVITWTTDMVADSQIEYGLTEEYGQETPTDSNMANEHEVTLSGLTPATRYFYRVVSANSFGVAACSPQGEFVLPEEPVVEDEEEPVVEEPVTTSRRSSGRRVTPQSQPETVIEVVETESLNNLPTNVSSNESIDRERRAKALSVDLAFGMRGESVVVLQEYLILKGFLAQGLATGYFGPLTRNAVIEFQKANNVTPAVGFVGPLTRLKIFQNW